jgi:SAM-dependent methyltransferase
MADPVADTVAYYDRHATSFAAQTADADLSPVYDRFLRHVRPGGRILDAGCGVARDALAFAQCGYDVVAFDASDEMVRLARERTGERVTFHRMRFEDVAWRGEFYGVWAYASLLHVPSTSFGGVASRLAEALQPGGARFMSFKLGEGERIAGERTCVDHTEETLRRGLMGVSVELLDVWISEDVRPGRARERWLNAIAIRPALTGRRMGHPE